MAESEHHHHHHTPQQDPNGVQQSQDVLVLRASQAGMRFIAQTHIYNGGNWERLRQFIADSYHDERLAEHSVEGRLQMFQTTQEKAGRMRVKQVVAANEHQIVVITEAEKDGDFFLVELLVEEDYPHKITGYQHRPLQPKD